jgi:RNA polymerase sigma-70 factor (family 1)
MSSYRSLSDAELTVLLKTGDRAAFAEIYERYKGPLYVHAFHRLQDREETKDLLQQLFTTLWEQREKLAVTGQFSGYLYTAVRNRVIKFVSHQQVSSRYIASVQTAINNTDGLTDRLVREKELQQLIEQEIAALPLKMREVFELSRKQHLSNAEIASQMGISEKTVRNQLNNALHSLRVKLGILGVLLFYLYH